MGRPCCCCKWPNTEVALMLDTTGSMSGTLDAFKTLFAKIVNSFHTGTTKWAIVEYRDYEDGGDFTQGYRRVQKFTTDAGATLTNLGALTVGGGGDLPEQNLWCLNKLLGDWWYSDYNEWCLKGSQGGIGITRRILWCGDAPGWNDCVGFPDKAIYLCYPTISTITTQLGNSDIELYAYNQGGEQQGIDGTAKANDSVYQASAFVAAASNGLLCNGVLDWTWDEVHHKMCYKVYHP